MESTTRNNKGRFIVGLATIAGILVGAVVAKATPGGRGTATSSSLTFAGTLNDANGDALTGMHSLKFTFKNNARTCPVTVPSVPGGPFSIAVDTSTCVDFFDGADVTVDIDVDGTNMAQNQPITPTAYAKYSDRAAGPGPNVADGGCDPGKVLGAVNGSFACIDPPSSGFTIGVYVGNTPGTTRGSIVSGALQGIPAAAALCAAQYGAGAHMCTSDEVYRSAASGAVSSTRNITKAWVWNPTWTPPVAGGTEPNAGVSDTCGAYTYPTADHRWVGKAVETATLITGQWGVRFYSGSTDAACNLLLPIACCK